MKGVLTMRQIIPKNDPAARELFITRLYDYARNSGIPICKYREAVLGYRQNTKLRWKLEKPIEVPPVLSVSQYMDIITASPGD